MRAPLAAGNEFSLSKWKTSSSCTQQKCFATRQSDHPFVASLPILNGITQTNFISITSRFDELLLVGGFPSIVLSILNVTLASSQYPRYFTKVFPPFFYFSFNFYVAGFVV